MTDPSLLVFAVLAAVGLLAAVMVVTRKNPVHSALYLVVTLFCVAAVYVLLHAEFLAVVQILVYAGGIMVLYLFVVFLVRPPREEESRWTDRRHLLAAVCLVAVVTVGLGTHLITVGAPAGPEEATTGLGGNIETVALTLFRHYLLPFETVSVLLLVAMVGAIVLARSEA